MKPDQAATSNAFRRNLSLPWLIAASLVVAGLIWANYAFLSSKSVSQTENRAAVGAARFSSALRSEIERSAMAVVLLSGEQSVRDALAKPETTEVVGYLMEAAGRMGLNALILTDGEYRLIAGVSQAEEVQFLSDLSQKGIRSQLGNSSFGFSLDGDGTGYVSVPVTSGEQMGYLLASIGVSGIENGWRQAGASIIVLDGAGQDILSSHDAWTRKQDRSSLHQAFEQQPGGFVGSDVPVVDANGRTLFANRSDLGFFGWQLYYLSTVNVINASTLSLLLANLLVVALAGLGILFHVNRRRSGEAQRIQQESSELRKLNSRLMEEISRREHLEQNLQSAEQNLEQASKLAALGQMAAAVSHELNQPLAAMKTYIAGSTLLLKRKRNEEAIVGLQRIDDLIARMSSITKQLKSFSRKSMLDFETMDVRTSITAVLDLMSTQIGKMGIEIRTDIPDYPVLVTADVLRVEQILVNLMRNALDAVAPISKPDIAIIVREQQKTASICVIDNGPGLENPDRLFEPFYTTKQPGEGLGLGLATSAGLATELRGRLVARNREDGGAEFELFLPMAETQIKAAE